MDYLKVVFEPEGRIFHVKNGYTVLEVAREFGIRIRSECGGIGSCGKCKIIVRDHSTISKLTDVERKLLSKDEIEAGYRLACQTIILKDSTFLIPMESRFDFLKIEISGVERTFTLNPPLKKFNLKLPKPSLLDIKPDLERIQSILTNSFNFKFPLEIDYEILKILPEILRNSDWKISIIIFNNKKIIDIQFEDIQKGLYGLAIDVGTSKLVIHLIDLINGKTIGMGSIENPQVLYGEDIISRINYASMRHENLKILQKLVIDGVNKILDELCVKHGVCRDEIYEAVIVGNTAMHHIFMGISPKYLALSPYVPVLKRSMNLMARDLGININSKGIITFLPIIAGFVGSDAIADVLATDIHKSKEKSILIDIGTNTEIFVGNVDELICCSCASGPAFEGMHIKYGIKAIEGAIEKVKINSNLEVEYEVIGDVKPKGICGSAVLDVVAELFKNGVIDRFGRFNVNVKSNRIKKGDRGFEFILAFSNETSINKDISINQKDIREVQLAKAAIYSGCSILMKKRNFIVDEIDKVFIAGAFGNYINIENAKIVGLIPDVSVDKIRFVGNTAVIGAKMALLSNEIRSEAELLIDKIHYHELAADPEFQKEFINAIPIPHKQIERFPSVLKYIKH